MTTETIYINEDTCKEYTLEEYDAKIAELEATEIEAFDYMSLFNDDYEVEEIEEVEKIVATGMEINACRILLRDEKEVESMKEVKLKPLKDAGKSKVWVGDELGGKYVSINSINNNRRALKEQKKMRCIDANKELRADLEKKFTSEEIEFIGNLTKEFNRFETHTITK